MVVGRMLYSPSDITGNSSAMPPACDHAPLHGLADAAEVGVAVGQLAPRVADADDRAAIKRMLAEALGPECGTPQPAV